MIDLEGGRSGSTALWKGLIDITDGIKQVPGSCGVKFSFFICVCDVSCLFVLEETHLSFHWVSLYTHFFD